LFRKNRLKCETALAKDQSSPSYKWK